VLAATLRTQLFRIRTQWISVIMSMETFQNVDEWLVSISADVGDVPTPCWNEVELGCVAGLDEETTGTGYLITPVCATDGLGCYDVAASLYSPIRSKQAYLTVL